MSIQGQALPVARAKHSVQFVNLGGPEKPKAADTKLGGPQKPKAADPKPANKTAAEEETPLASEPYVWFAAGALVFIFGTCCLIPAIDPEGATFNMVVDLAIVGSVTLVVTDLVTSQGSDEQHEESAMMVVPQHLFNVFFSGEVAVRMRYEGFYWFCNPWNLFDFLLVAVTALELWILPILEHELSNFSAEDLLEKYGWMPMAFRSLRLFRLLRLLRLLRPNSSFRMPAKDDGSMDELAEVWLTAPKEREERPAPSGKGKSSGKGGA